MTDTIDLNRKAHVVLGRGGLRTLYPVIVLSRGPRFARVRFLVNCNKFGAKKGDVEFISTDILLDLD